MCNYCAFCHTWCGIYCSMARFVLYFVVRHGMGACCNSFFHFFPPFLAKSWPFNGSVQRGQICERTNFFHFSARSGKIWRCWPATTTRFFFSARLTFSPFFLDHHGARRTTPDTRTPLNATSESPNYRNDILINIVEQQLPQGLEAWRNVACLYQTAANENELRR